MSIIGDIDKAIDTVVGDIEGATSNVVTPPSVIKGHNQYSYLNSQPRNHFSYEPWKWEPCGYNNTAY